MKFSLSQYFHQNQKSLSSKIQEVFHESWLNATGKDESDDYSLISMLAKATSAPPATMPNKPDLMIPG